MRTLGMAPVLPSLSWSWAKVSLQENGSHSDNTHNPASSIVYADAEQLSYKTAQESPRGGQPWLGSPVVDRYSGSAEGAAITEGRWGRTCRVQQGGKHCSCRKCYSLLSLGTNHLQTQSVFIIYLRGAKKIAASPVMLYCFERGMCRGCFVAYHSK